MVPVIAFAGYSKTGKTTLIERLIPLLKRRGLKVGVMKHHQGDFEIDKPGKDSYRYTEAGAEVSIIAGSHGLAMVRQTDRELTLEQMVSGYLHGVDLVILEGFNAEKVPRIEVVRKGESGPLRCAGDPDLLAVVADGPVDVPLPVFHRDDLEGIASFVVSRIFAAAGGTGGH